MYSIWHQTVKNCISFGTQTQLRSVRQSPYFLPSRNSQSQLLAFLACSYSLGRSSRRPRPELHGRQEEFLYGMWQSLKLSARGTSGMPIKFLKARVF